MLPVAKEKEDYKDYFQHIRLKKRTCPGQRGHMVNLDMEETWLSSQDLLSGNNMAAACHTHHRLLKTKWLPSMCYGLLGHKAGLKVKIRSEHMVTLDMEETWLSNHVFLSGNNMAASRYTPQTAQNKMAASHALWSPRTQSRLWKTK